MITNFIDAETRVIMNGVPFLSPEEQRYAEQYARERIQAFIAGISRTPATVNKFLKHETGDDRLQLRWCFDLNTWILERWQDDGYWLQVMVPLNSFNQTPQLNTVFMKNLCNLLRSNDLQRVDADEYIRSKRNAANAVKAENRKKSDVALMAAVDAMSLKQIQSFIDVHRALHTGETIVAHGKDEKSLERMAEVSRTHAHEVPVNKAMNQGMHPLGYKRTARQPR